MDIFFQIFEFNSYINISDSNFLIFDQYVVILSSAIKKRYKVEKEETSSIVRNMFY